MPRAKAEQIARDYLRSSGFDLARLKLDLRWDGFGWREVASFPDEDGKVFFGGESYFGIRDSGMFCTSTEDFEGARDEERLP